MNASLKEKCKNFNNPNDNDLIQIQRHIWNQYNNEPQLIQILFQFYLEKNGLKEVFSINFNNILFFFRLLRF